MLSISSLESDAIVLLRLADLLAVVALPLSDAVWRAEVALHVRVEDLRRKMEQGVSNNIITLLLLNLLVSGIT